MKIIQLFICLLFAISSIGCAPESEEIKSKWIDLYSKPDCLTGGQHWNKRGIREGSVFRQNEWQTFFKQPSEIMIPFLMDRLPSMKATQIHVCPFENAIEGELAVYVAEHIAKKNWYKAGSGYSQLSKWAIKKKESSSPVIKLMLNDDKAISELEKYFLKGIQ